MLRWTKIRLDEELVWVDFRYENMPTFCFYCGRLGHAGRGCEQKMVDSRNNCICEGQHGNWLRAQVVKIEKMGESSETRRVENLSSQTRADSSRGVHSNSNRI